MLTLEQLKNKTDLINLIDWEMTPEEAIRLYLEWGNNWVHDKYVIRSDSDVSVYFMVYAWDDPPVIYLIRRNMKDTEELAKIYMPEGLKNKFLNETGCNKGVYKLDGEVKSWLKSQFNVN
jgi:hypothetical protein